VKKLWPIKKLKKVFREDNRKEVNFDSLPSLLTIDQVSEILCVHPNTLRNWDKEGKLKAVRIGARKDRRYDKKSVMAFYNGVSLKDKKGKPEKKPEESNYILKPGFSKQWLRLLWISKRFSIFVYSVSLVAFFFVVLQVSFFAYVYYVQAGEKPLEIHKFRVEPAQLSGWQGSLKAKSVDLLSTASQSDFSEKNSAVFHNKPITEEENLETIEAYLAGLESEFEVGGYKLPKELPAGGVVRKANVIISLAADTYENNEDVVTFSYSYDGDSWHILDSFALTEEVSNATHEGFWIYPLEITKETTPEDMENLRVKVAYNAVPGPKEAKTFLDGIALEVDIQEPDPIKKEIAESVELPKRDFGVLEEPKIKVAIKEDKLFGTKKRTVKSVSITDPAGQVGDIEYQVEEIIEGKIKKTEYKINPEQGRYTISFAIEQDGKLEQVEQDFTWGVLAFNPDQAIYKSGQSALFSIGVIDDNGQPVCDAEVTVEVTDPGQQKTIFTTNDGSIAVSEHCTVKDVYVEPDYSAAYMPPMAGEYKVYIAAVHHQGRRTLHDSFKVELNPAYTIKRDGPTRIFPNVMQPMRLTVTAFENFDGEIKDYAGRKFNIEALDGGIVRPFDTGTEIANEIVWNRSIPAGTSVTVSYNFDAPPKSPALFHLGPAKIGDWDEGRQWQLAIDPANMLLLGKTSSAPGGWSYVSTYNSRYIRGNSTYSGTSGNSTHTHTVSDVTVGTPAETAKELGLTQALATGHAHSTTNPTVGSGSNNPAYAYFTLWKYDSGVPTTVPQNAYALFDADPGGSWVRYATADSRLIKLSSAQGTGGSDTHTHSLTWQALGFASGTLLSVNTSQLSPYSSQDKHTHTAPSATTSDPYTSVPQYTTTIIYEQTNATSQVVPYGMMAMFDATPPDGWTVVSGVGNDYYQRFVQGNVTEGTQAGSNTHSMADETSGNSGGPSATNTRGAKGSGVASGDHTHTQTASFSPSTSHVPLYVDVIIAQYTGLTIEGTLYQDDESTAVGADEPVNLYVNGDNNVCGGAACTTTTGAGGGFTFNNVIANSGDIILIASHHSSYQGNNVFVSDGTDVADAHVYAEAVIVRHDTGTSITNADLGTADPGDYGYYSVSSNDLVVGSGHELHVWTGDTYDPNGIVNTNVTGGDFHIDDGATAYLDSAINSIGVDINIDSGATLHVQNATLVNGDDVTTAGALNHTGGTFTIGNGTTEDLIVNSGAVVTLSGGTTNIKDDIIHNGGTTTISNIVNLNSASVDEDLDLNGGTVYVNSGADLNIYDDIDQDGGTFDINGTADVDVTDRYEKNGASSVLELDGGSLTTGDYLLNYGGTLNLDGGTHTVGTAGFLYFSPTAASEFNMTGGSITTKEIYVASAGTFNQTTVSGGTIILDNSASSYLDIRRTGVELYNVTIADNASIDSNSVSFDVKGLFTINNGITFDANSTGESMRVYGGWDNSGTFTYGDSTITLLGGNISGSADTTFYNLTLGDGTTSATVTVNGTDDPTVTNTLDVDADDTLSIGASRTVTLNRNGSLTLDGTISGAGRFTYMPSAAFPRSDYERPDLWRVSRGL